MRHLFFLCVLLAFPLSITAQKKELSTAKANLKQGKNLEQSEKDMRKLLEQPANRQNEKIWLTLFDIVKKQYDQGNEKLYLKQNYDTAKIFQLTEKMFDVLERFDSIDAMPDGNGIVKPKHRKKHASLLNDYRPNLYNGGRYFVNKKNYKEGFQCYDMYIGCTTMPLFEQYRYESDSTLLREAAYWASFCAHQQKDTEATLSHKDLALKDHAHHNSLLQILSDTYLLKGDTLHYLETLNEGFQKYTLTPYFFQNLVQHYGVLQEWKTILKYANQGIEVDSVGVKFLFSKCAALLNMGRYEECISVGNKIIAINDSIAEIYYNVGLAHFNQAVLLDKNVKKTAKQKNQMMEQYQKARPFMERYRALAPDKQQQWASPLYTIYLNLNMGKEFEEINKLIRQNSK